MKSAVIWFGHKSKKWTSEATVSEFFYNKEFISCKIGEYNLKSVSVKILKLTSSSQSCG